MAGRWLLRIVAIVGLGIDVYVHFHLAANFDSLKDPGSFKVSQGQLFRVEGVAAAVALVLLAVLHKRWTAAFAFLVLAGGVAAVLLYRYVDVGSLGPFPNMYDATWYGEKTLSAVAEGVAAVAALWLFFAESGGRGLRRRAESS